MIVPIETVRRRVAELMLAGVPMDDAVQAAAVALGLPVEAVVQAMEQEQAA